METKNEKTNKNKTTKNYKQIKAHQDIYLVLLFASESGSLRFTLYVNF
jgi:hypothetical protein